MVICLEQGADGLHFIHLMPLQIGFTFLLPAYRDCPGKEAIKWVSVSLGNRKGASGLCYPKVSLLRLQLSTGNDEL